MSARLYFFITPFVALMFFVQLARGAVLVPTYKVDKDVVHVESVAALKAAPAEVFDMSYLDVAIGENVPALGQSSKLLKRSEFPGAHPNVPNAYPTLLAAEPEGVFALWRVQDDLTKRPEGAVALAFDISAASARQIYLGIGADDRYIILLNGETVSIRAGYQYHLVCSNIVPLALSSGINHVTILAACERHRAAARYFAPAWEMSLWLFTDEISALAMHDQKNRHCLLTPLVSSASLIACCNGSPVYRHARMLDAKGDLLSEGDVQEDGAILWEKEISPEVHLARVEIDGARGEPVFIAPSAQLDATVVNTLSQIATNDPFDPWRLRVEHLLKPEFRAMRSVDSKWAAKLVAAIDQTARKERVATEMIKGRPVTSWSLYQYTSEIDGTTQYYGFYVPPPHSRPAESIPVIAILPDVPSPVRPFLESAVFAGTDQVEQWCSVADQLGVALVWPGFVDVDYGGKIAQRQLQEVLDDFYQREPRAGALYLMGICSSSVTALEYINKNPGAARGVVLHAPVLSRQTRRFTPGLWGDPVPCHFVPETTESVIGAFKVDRCAVLFDVGFPGHGELAKLPNFLALASQRGASVTDFGVTHVEGYLWGERMNQRLVKLFGWVRQPGSTVQEARYEPKPPSAAEPESVEDALLSGFTLAENADSEIERSWFSWWSAQYARWRGTPISAGKPRRLPYSLVLSEISDDELRSRFSVAAGVEPEKWVAVFLDREKKRVVVARNPAAKGPFPKVDIMLDGHFREALWRQSTGGSWALQKISY